MTTYYVKFCCGYFVAILKSILHTIPNVKITIFAYMDNNRRRDFTIIPYSLKFSRLKIFADFVGQRMAAKNFSSKISSS